jgi:hypothetical protein
MVYAVRGRRYAGHHATTAMLRDLILDDEPRETKLSS